MADLTRLSESEIRKQMEAARKVADEIAASDDREVVRSGRADAVLARLEAAGDTFTAAKAELARRAQAEGTHRQASEIFIQQGVQLDEWALDPTPMHMKERERGRHMEPDPYEPIRKTFHLLRNKLPAPLVWEEMDGARLTPQEGEELHELVLRGRKGGLDAGGVSRIHALLEQIAGAAPGAIEAHRQFLEQREAEERQRAEARRDAESRAEVERERHLSSLGVRTR